MIPFRMTKFLKTTERKLHVVDAAGVPMGRLASQISRLLVGKHKVSYTPNFDSGDRVEVEHLAAVKWTGNKAVNKVYRHHTGYPGGLAEEKLATRWERDPVGVLRAAVRGMLPKTRHRPAMLKRLTVK